MKSERLIDALGKIDDELLLDVQPAAVMMKQKSRWPLWVMTAAVVALCFFGAYKLGGRQPVNMDDPVIQDQPHEEEAEKPENPQAQAVRTYLQANTQNAAPYFQQEARAVITDYIQTHSDEFRYLPDFYEGGKPAWDALTLFALMNSDHEGTMTEQQLEQAVGTFMDMEIEHQSSSHLQYENGLYTVMARGLGDDPVCYGLEQIDESGDGVYEIVVVGVGFWYEDLFEQTTEHSRNYKLLQEFYADLTPENLQERMYGYLHDHGAGDFEVTERILIKLRLQDGDRPFRYLACKREILEEPTFTEEEYLDLRSRLYGAPDPDEAGSLAIDAFIQYFTDNPYEMQDYGSWEFSLSREEWNGEALAVLHCSGPLWVTTGPSQCFQYSYETGEVRYGPSGTWTQEPYDAAEGVRRTLLNEEGVLRESIHIREAFARYFMENPQELERLKDFGQTELVCYALEECVISDMTGDDPYFPYFTVTLVGFGFKEADWSEDETGWSCNRKLLEQLVGNVDETNYREKMLPYLYETEPVLQPFQITERVRLTFRLVKNGEAAVPVYEFGQPVTVMTTNSPFQFVSWNRAEVGAVDVSLVEDDFRDKLVNTEHGWFKIGSSKEESQNVLFRFNDTVKRFGFGPLEAGEGGFTITQTFYVNNTPSEPGDLEVLEVRLEPQVYAYGFYIIDENGVTRSFAVSLSQFGEELVVMEI